MTPKKKSEQQGVVVHIRPLFRIYRRQHYAASGLRMRHARPSAEASLAPAGIVVREGCRARCVPDSASPPPQREGVGLALTARLPRIQETVPGHPAVAALGAFEVPKALLAVHKRNPLAGLCCGAAGRVWGRLNLNTPLCIQVLLKRPSRLEGPRARTLPNPRHDFLSLRN